jgi:hypothetical protein
MHAFDAAFGREFGISMAELARRYDEARRAEVAVVEDHANRLAQQARDFQAALDRSPGRPEAVRPDPAVKRLEADLQALRERLADTDARLAAAGALVANLMDELQQEESKRRELEELLVHRDAGIDAGPLSPSSGEPSPEPGVLAALAPAPLAGTAPHLRLRIISLAHRLHLHGPLRRVYRWLTGKGSTGSRAAGPLPIEPPPLTARAREIQQGLKSALANKDKKGD